MCHVDGEFSVGVIRRHGTDEHGRPVVDVQFDDGTSADDVRPHEILRAVSPNGGGK